MSARDELTTLILGKTAPRAADAILAAGYTKPRQIENVEELDALPVRSVILDNYSDTCRKNRYGRWESLDEPDQTWDGLGMTGSLPAVLLHEPEADA